VREPATSCSDCGRVLLPAEVVYTPAAAIVCEACVPTDGSRAVTMRIRTRADRRRSLRRWSWLFAGLTLTAGYVGQISRSQLRAARAMATIDFPGARTAIPRQLVVRGHVVADTITRPLWLVARSTSPATGPCVAQTRLPVVAERTGLFTVAVDLGPLSAGDVHLSVVSIDESASEAFESPPAVSPHGFSAGDCRGMTGAGELPRGALVLASVDVTLSDT
jgi:hypothetical protein